MKIPITIDAKVIGVANTPENGLINCILWAEQCSLAYATDGKNKEAVKEIQLKTRKEQSQRKKEISMSFTITTSDGHEYTYAMPESVVVALYEKLLFDLCSHGDRDKLYISNMWINIESW